MGQLITFAKDEPTTATSVPLCGLLLSSCTLLGDSAVWQPSSEVSAAGRYTCVTTFELTARQCIPKHLQSRVVCKC